MIKIMIITFVTSLATLFTLFKLRKKDILSNFNQRVIETYKKDYFYCEANFPIPSKYKALVIYIIKKLYSLKLHHY